jgi:hypothetical protein
MATITRIPLSASVNGKGVKVAQTAIATPGTAIHQAAAGVGSTDYVDLYAANEDDTVRVLVIGWGDTGAIDNTITVSLSPKSGLIPIAERLPINNGLYVRAATDVANKVVIYGSVARLA